MEQQLAQEITKNPLALYGALIATVSLLFSLFSLWMSFWVARRDRARIVVTGLSGYKVTPGGPYDPTRDYLIITVSNEGRRPRIISKVGVRLRTGPSKHLISSDAIHKGPQEIKESGSCFWLMQYGAHQNLDLDNIKAVWACDQTSKMYWGTFQRLDQL